MYRLCYIRFLYDESINNIKFYGEINITDSMKLEHIAQELANQSGVKLFNRSTAKVSLHILYVTEYMSLGEKDCGVYDVSLQKVNTTNEEIAKKEYEERLKNILLTIPEGLGKMMLKYVDKLWEVKRNEKNEKDRILEKKMRIIRDTVKDIKSMYSE